MILTAVDASLRRLGTDVIDIYQLHWWDKRTPFAAIFETLERLVQAGKIRAYGSTNVTLEMIGISAPATTLELHLHIDGVQPGSFTQSGRGFRGCALAKTPTR